MYNWTTPIRYVKGLGPVRSQELTKIGINTVGDLLQRKPLSHIYPGVTPIADAKEGMVVIRAKIEEIGLHPYSCRGVVQATLADDTGCCQATWYNSPWLLANLRPGVTATFWGKYRGGVLQQPKWTTVESSMVDVYGGQYGVHHDTIRRALGEVLSDLELPRMNDGTRRQYVYEAFHFPKDKTEQQLAERLLRHDEALQMMVALQERRVKREQVKSKVTEWTEDMANQITDYFSYVFTKDQCAAKNQIVADLAIGDRPMRRLLHGEVGSGKTAVAFYAAMLAALNGKRTLILCPTTILAQQHYDTLKGMGWDDVGLYVSHQNRKLDVCYGGLGPQIIIGTHALLNNERLLDSAAFVIIDEVQKFGVEQKAKINPSSHLLLLSATPIPRTLAATVFSDLDVSVIRQLPIARGQVVTRWVLPEKREGVYEIIEQELAKGKQVYVICPKIGEEDQEDLTAVNQMWDKLYTRWGHKYATSMLTGRNPTDSKNAVLRDFRSGVIRVLVSTIIAEVGLDNPNATVMVVEGADRFGLSQLHQLRGRVCRSKDTAYCFLVAETANQTSIDRLTVIERCVDGFEIAEHDLRLRGPGEAFSTRQHGLPDFNFIDLVEDFDLIAEARDMVAAGDVGEGVKEMMRLQYENLELGDVV